VEGKSVEEVTSYRDALFERGPTMLAEWERIERKILEGTFRARVRVRVRVRYRVRVRVRVRARQCSQSGSGLSGRSSRVRFVVFGP
jgi:hypothetical protein